MNRIEMPGKNYSGRIGLLLGCLALLASIGSFLDGGLAAATRGKIAGKIVNAASGESLPVVNVVLVGTFMGAATDNQGDYFIANVPVGVYTLRATMIGYQTTTVTEVLVSTNITTEVHLELQPTTLEGEEIVVTAERAVVEMDNTSSIVVLESETIMAQPTTEFEDVLLTLPSINIEEGVMKFRGGTLDEVAFMIDGTRMRNPLDHSPYTNVNLSSIQEVEVITGSFNAEYGEARSGVVNITTKTGSDRYELYVDSRILPPGKRHWGVALYDESTELYWENTHARHLDWWIENTDQWVDDNGVYGYDAYCEWTPEEAHQIYIERHQPLSDYANETGHQTEISFGGPVPMSSKLHFHLTGKQRTTPPLYGNAYRSPGMFFDGTIKLSYHMTPNTNLAFFGLYSTENTSWGVEGDPNSDNWYVSDFGITSRYAYFDWEGYPTTRTDGQTLRLSHMLSSKTVMEINASRVQAKRQVDVFPDDPYGWEMTEATRDNLRGVDSNGNPIVGGYANAIGYHTTGYYYRFNDVNTELNMTGYIGSQRNKYLYLKSGFELTYYLLNHWNEAKFPARLDSALYNPLQGAIYSQGKLELGGLIVNAGLRFDFYQPNDTIYTDIFDPFNGPKENSESYYQLSPRLGLSHPISDRSVLHFSYGHFFQRPPFGDYGEGNSEDQQLGSLTTFRIKDTNFPWVLGNRKLKPAKTVAFEVGIERSFVDHYVIDITGYYKDTRNTIRAMSVMTPQGTYVSNGNGNYADDRGFEISFRKIPSQSWYGSISGYISYTTRSGINGSSGDPTFIKYDDSKGYGTSGDNIEHIRPRAKALIYYETPTELKGLLSLFNGISVSLDYLAVYTNEYITSDYFRYDGKRHYRPPDENTNLRVKKLISLAGGTVRIRPYLEVHNLLNHKWIDLGVVEAASNEDQAKFADSEWDYLPDYNAVGVPYMEMAKYRNLPRSILFGATLEFN